MTNQPPTPPSCNCGHDNERSARYGNGHLNWCTARKLARDLELAISALETVASMYDHAATVLGTEPSIPSIARQQNREAATTLRAHLQVLATAEEMKAELTNCGHDDKQSARYGNGHLAWCASCKLTLQPPFPTMDDYVRLLRMFEPALSSRIPPMEEVLARAASLVALEAGMIDAVGVARHGGSMKWADEDRRDWRLAAGLEATRRRLATGADLPPYPTREEWRQLVEYLETEEPSVFVDRIREAITAHLDTLAQAGARRAEQELKALQAGIARLEQEMQQCCICDGRRVGLGGQAGGAAPGDQK